MQAYIKRLICIAYVALLLALLCACSVENVPGATQTLPPQEKATPTPAMPTATPAAPVEESFTITASEEHVLKNYTAACSVFTDAKDPMQDFCIDYTFTHVLPSGEVETEVKTLITRTVRHCSHTGGDVNAALKSYEDGEIYALPEYEAECPIEAGCFDKMLDYVYDRVYYYTYLTGEERTATKTIHRETIRTCEHQPQVTGAE